jgi:membrane-associated phospholipid phosphatase
VHWPGDVLAGALWGALAALAAWAVARRVIRPRGAAPGGPTS